MERLKGLIESRLQTIETLMNRGEGWDPKVYQKMILKTIEHNLLSIAKEALRLSIVKKPVIPTSDMTHLFESIPQLNQSLSTKAWN